MGYLVLWIVVLSIILVVLFIVSVVLFREVKKRENTIKLIKKTAKEGRCKATQEGFALPNSRLSWAIDALDKIKNI